MDTMFRDLRHAIRTSWKSPSFAAAVILTLALGIGVNVSVFTVLHAALLQSLPVSQPDRLVQVYTWTQKGGDHFDFSYPLYVDFRDGNKVLSGLSAYTSGAIGVTVGGRSERVIAEFVTANYFPLLGVDLSMGPGLSGSDELRGGPATAVISQRLWRELFRSDPLVLGKPVLLNGKAFTIVGVAPPRFDGVVRGQRADVWTTVAQFFPLRNQPDLLDERNSSWMTLLGRLAPGVTPEQAASQLSSLGRELPGRSGHIGDAVRVRSAGGGDMDLVEGLVSPLRLLMIVVGLILVIASANVANLLLARSYARQPEIALRQALGASRVRIVRQLLTEGAVLSFAGGALALLLAGWFLALFEFRTTGGTLLVLSLDLDWTVVGFAAALAALATIGAGLLPAISTSRPDLLLVIKGAGDSVRSHLGTRHLRTALVVVQIALSLVLVVGAGLFLRSLAHLRAVDPAIADNHVLAATINLTLRGYPQERGRQFYLDVFDRVNALPGVQSATLAYVLPVTAGGIRMDLNARSTTPPVDSVVGFDLIPVAPRFFETVAIPLVGGRDFTTRDSHGAPRVTIVNETMKQRFWPGVDAVGQTFIAGGGTYQVVGIARDSKYRSLREGARMTMYLPLAQSYQLSANLLVRTALPIEAVVESVRAELRQIDPAMPLYNVRTLAEHIDRSLHVDRLRARLISWLAALAVALAAIGIYGVVSYSVAERTREMGVRLALGANPDAVMRMVLATGVKLATVGVVVGLGLAVWLTRLVTSQLFGVTGTDPLTLAGSAAALFAVVLLATFVPARRATRIDPIAALRE